MIEAQTPEDNDLLMRRFQKTIPDEVERIRFIPRLDRKDFLNLLSVSDVVLDPLHYGSGNTAYECLSVGTPLVTWPGEFMRGRYVYACYRKMGITDCVASSLEEYVEISCRLGTDPAYRMSVKEKILAANHVLFEDMEVVREHERFFLWAIEKARAGRS